MDEKLEELQKEIARLSVEVEMLRAKVRICFEAIARLREEFESLKRKTRKPSLKEYCEVMEAGEPEPP